MTQSFRVRGFSGCLRYACNGTAVLASIVARVAPLSRLVTGGAHETLRDRRRVAAAARCFARAGIDDRLDEIRAARFVRSAASAS